MAWQDRAKELLDQLESGADPVEIEAAHVRTIVELEDDR